VPNIYLLAAAALAISTAIVHSWLGERVLIGPLLAPERREYPLASDFKRDVLRYAWHLTSLAWVGMGAAFAALAFAPLQPQGRLAILILGTTFLLHGLITLVISRGKHLAWLAFLAIAGLAFTPLL